MSDQERLFRLAVEAITVTAQHEWNRGWRVKVGYRRGDETWHEADGRTYSYLSTPELADVVEAELSRILGLA